MVPETRDERIKTIEVVGAHSKTAQVAYYNEGDTVYFCGITPLGEAYSTVHMSEEIIREICDTLEFDWRNVSFFDIHTASGYPGMPSGTVEIFQLEIARGENQHPHATDWHERFSKRFKAESFATDCPKVMGGILEHFRSFIFTDN